MKKRKKKLEVKLPIYINGNTMWQSHRRLTQAIAKQTLPLKDVKSRFLSHKVTDLSTDLWVILADELTLTAAHSLKCSEFQFFPLRLTRQKQNHKIQWLVSGPICPVKWQQHYNFAAEHCCGFTASVQAGGPNFWLGGNKTTHNFDTWDIVSLHFQYHQWRHSL